MDVFVSVPSDFVILLALWSGVWGPFCAWLAREQGRDRVIWFFLGFFFWLIALVALAVPRL